MKNINLEISKKRERFHQFLSEPDQADFAEVQELCKEYPYSQALWFLLARLSIARNEVDAKRIYQKAALFCSDPEELRVYVSSQKKQVTEYIETEEYNKDEEIDEPDALIEENVYQEKDISQNKEDSVSKEVSVTKKDEQEEHESPSRYIDDWMPYSYVWWLQKTRMEYAGTYQPYVSGNPGEQKSTKVRNNDPVNPLDQQIREHIFNLQDPEEKLSEQFGGKAKPFQVPHKENPIIEKFIKEEPQIKPPTAEKINLENKARKSAEDNSGFVSETLAQIYTEQGLYHKALDTYKKLSLKYPEKSLYFAKLIEELNQKLN